MLGLAIAMTLCLSAREYHVSPKGNDLNAGSVSAPLKTIQNAASVVVAGDVITVHAGVYREWIDPKNGGNSDSERIIYQVAEGEKVELKGSEVITGWKKQKDGTWSVTLPDKFFKGYNSCMTDIYGDWYWAYDKNVNRNHTADLYINGKSMFEADSLSHVVKGVCYERAVDKEAATYRWFSKNDEKGTTIWANFHNIDPNKEQIEISVRPTCFYSTRQGVNYITIKGFHISQAATQWDAPTAHQIGMVATHWNKGWIIEDNVIHDTKCSGITLGKEESTGHNVWSKNMTKDGSLHYIETTFRAIEHHWDKEHVGSHIVRNNIIYNCEQCGICGSMGCSFSEVYNNHIYNIWVKRQFDGAEISGIKFHAAIDTKIYDNNIHDCQRGIWLDWMAQGTRVSSNLFYNNYSEDLFFEVNHGPFIIDNNICLSDNAVRNQSEGGAYIHNLFCGNNLTWREHGRYTPYHYGKSTRIKGLSIVSAGDDRYINNVFMSMGKNNNQHGLQIYNDSKFPQKTLALGNVYYNDAKPYIHEEKYIGVNDKPYRSRIETESNGDSYLILNLEAVDALKNTLVKSQLLGRTFVSEELFTDTNDREIVFDKDYFGKQRAVSPSSGPFEKPKSSEDIRIKVWPKY